MSSGGNEVQNNLEHKMATSWGITKRMH